jgi:hypothetical protein
VKNLFPVGCTVELKPHAKNYWPKYKKAIGKISDYKKNNATMALVLWSDRKRAEPWYVWWLMRVYRKRK